MLKVAVLGRDSLSTRLLLNKLTDAGYGVVWYEERRDDRVELLRRRALKFGYLFVFSQLVFQFFQKILYRCSGSRIKALVGDVLALNTISPRNVFPNINAVNFADLFKEGCVLVVLSGTRILSAKTIERLNGMPVVNIHAGITPGYRGVHGGYWALASCDPNNFGATIHYVDSGIDTGNVIAHVRVSPTKRDNFTTYPLLQQKSAVDVLLNLIPEIINGKFQGGAEYLGDDAGISRVWTHPTIIQYFSNYIKYRVK